MSRDATLPPTRAAVLDEIVRAAAAGFGEVGYRAATLDAIAERAGISKVTLYRYVSSKEDLLSLVVERIIASFRQGLRQIVEQRRPAEETLRRIIRYQVTLLAENLPFLTVFFSEESGLPAPMAAQAARAKREYDSTIERVVREGVESGRLRPLPPTMVVFGILGARASRNLGLSAHATFSGALAWPYIYPWPQRPPASSRTNSSGIEASPYHSPPRQIPAPATRTRPT